MSGFQFPPSIISRPVYGAFEVRLNKHCLMIADAEGAEAILDMADKTDDSQAMMANTHIIYIPKHTGKIYVKRLQALGAQLFFAEANFDASVPRLKQALSTAHMGLQVYLAGTEGLIGLAQREAIEAGIPHTAIQTEHRGSVARRMQCVHCKGITEDVITDPFTCSHCGLHLFVRDHYSRRLAAFQAVRVDAEDHGNVPDQVELYK
ncbi:hypothetical protein N9X12_02750 [Alphaproteobacteria bacterium]|nr:hypothetical protein [Alphaproteobacteria bacterium]